VPGGGLVFVRFFSGRSFFEKFSGKIRPGFFEIFLLNVIINKLIRPDRGLIKNVRQFFLHMVFSGKFTGLAR
jgi:hypothetical protein